MFYVEVTSCHEAATSSLSFCDSNSHGKSPAFKDLGQEHTKQKAAARAVIQHPAVFSTQTTLQRQHTHPHFVDYPNLQSQPSFTVSLTLWSRKQFSVPITASPGQEPQVRDHWGLALLLLMDWLHGRLWLYILLLNYFITLHYFM